MGSSIQAWCCAWVEEIKKTSLSCCCTKTSTETTQKIFFPIWLGSNNYPQAPPKSSSNDATGLQKWVAGPPCANLVPQYQFCSNVGIHFESPGSLWGAFWSDIRFVRWTIFSAIFCWTVVVKTFQNWLPGPHCCLQNHIQTSLCNFGHIFGALVITFWSSGTLNINLS